MRIESSGGCTDATPVDSQQQTPEVSLGITQAMHLHTRHHRCQVLHPFYVFQIASIILWGIDDYYYYAFCILLISALSIGSTLLETKQVS